MLKRLLISGSRDASPQMLDFARRCVGRAQQQGYVVLVGDAAGVDAAVVKQCLLLNVPCVCVGIARQPRNGGGKNKRSTYLPFGSTYSDRDRYLVECADIVMCIWNGISNGTLAVHEYARQFRFKEVHLKTFEVVSGI